MGHYSLRGQQGKNPMMNWSGTKPGECDISEAKWRKNFRKEGVTKSVKNFWDVWKDKDWEIVIELARWRSLVTSRVCWGGRNQNMEEWVIQDREEGEEVKLLHKSHMGAIIYTQ